MQVPEVRRVTELPDTVQTLAVYEAKLTGRVELAVAERLSEPPAVWVGIALNVMVGGCR